MRSQSDAPPLLDHFAEIAPRYEALLCDIWGVVHNGVAAHEEAVDALVRFRRELGGAVVLITNAPRPSGPVEEMLRRLGVPGNAYDRIISSGDLTRALLMQRAGQRVHHIGPARDRPVFEGIDLAFCPIAEAEFVLCTGLFDDDRETPEDYKDTITAMRARDLEMICANPDLMVERGDALIYCAGAIAQAYEAAGGAVIYAGKPHRPIYEAALDMFAGLRGTPPEKSRVLAIGDNLRTDLAGAAAFGLDMLFIAAGVHAGDGESEMAKLFAQATALPQALQPRLRW